MSELYNRIDRMCKERGTNITALCRDAKVARASLSELKAGRTKTLTLETGAKIASVLGISVDELMGTEKEKAPLVNNDPELTEYLEELRTRPEMKMLFSLAKNATKEDVEKAVKIVETLLGK